MTGQHRAESPVVLKVNAAAVAYIRTYVPLAVVAGVAWVAAHFGVVIPASSKVELTSLLTAAAVALYYALAHELEKRAPKFGVLLGIPRAPAYTAESVVAPLALVAPAVVVDGSAPGHSDSK